MYSWEIDKLLSEKQYTISGKDYNKITNTVQNPQVNSIKYDAFSDMFRVSTIDGYSWTFKVAINK